jgi:O-antigen/teichoic acid export membrane protein
MRGSAWVALSYGGRQVVMFGSMLVLVRFVEPKAFGVVALSFTVLYILSTLQDSGLGAALVHRRGDVTDAAATVFVFSIITGLLLYAIAFFAAPFIAKLFHTDGLTTVLRALSLLLPLHSLSTVPSALLERAVHYRPRTVSDLLAALAQGATSIVLAVLGAGVWALVVGQLAAGLVSAVVLWVMCPTRPDPRRASVATARSLMTYGRFITAGNLLTIAGGSIDNITVARLMSATSLGFYSVAYRVTELPVLVIGSIVGRVMFPIYSMVREDVAIVRRAYLQNLQRVALLSVPVSVGMAVGARPLVRVLLGEKWLPSVAAVQVLAIFAVIRSLIGPAGELFKGMGKPQYNLVTGGLFLPLAVPLLWVLIHAKGIIGAALAVLITASVIAIVVYALVFHLLEFGPRELFAALGPFLATAALVALAIQVVVVTTEHLDPSVSLALAIVAGAAGMALGTAVFSRSIVTEMWRSLRRSRLPEDAPTPA